jgi:hypothetical protein
MTQEATERKRRPIMPNPNRLTSAESVDEAVFTAERRAPPKAKGKCRKFTICGATPIATRRREHTAKNTVMMTHI